MKKVSSTEKSVRLWQHLTYPPSPPLCSEGDSFSLSDANTAARFAAKAREAATRRKVNRNLMFPRPSPARTRAWTLLRPSPKACIPHVLTSLFYGYLHVVLPTVALLHPLWHLQVPAQQPPAVAAQPRAHPQAQHQAQSSAGGRAGRFWHCPKCRITNAQGQHECSQCGTSAAAGLPVVRARVLPAAGGRVGTLLLLALP